MASQFIFTPFLVNTSAYYDIKWTDRERKVRKGSKFDPCVSQCLQQLKVISFGEMAIMKRWGYYTLRVVLAFGIFISMSIPCNGHAIFWEPPSRASLGKHNMNFCNVPINDDHMSLYCGGIVVSF